MAPYEIVSDQTRFDVTTRPGMPGLGAHVRGVRGTFEATFRDDGTVDLTHPVEGRFTMTVDDVQTGNKLVTAGVRTWLGSADEAPVQGSVQEVRDNGDGRLRFAMAVEVKGRTARLVGLGRIEVRPHGQIEATGGTMCDPRSFGIPLPPLLNLTVHVRWRIVLAAEAVADVEG